MTTLKRKSMIHCENGKKNSQKPNTLQVTTFNIKKAMAENKSYENISKDTDEFSPKLNR